MPGLWPVHQDHHAALADQYIVVLLVQLVLLVYVLGYLATALHVTYRGTWSKSTLKGLGLLLLFLPMIGGAIEFTSHI